MDGRNGGFDQLGNGASATQVMQDFLSVSAHAAQYAIIGSISQAPICDNRHCDDMRVGDNGRMSKVAQIEAVAIFERLDALELTQRELAGVLGIEENKITKVKTGVRRFTASEVNKASAWLDDVEARGGYRETADLPVAPADRDYVPVEVLPSYGGMGGGGSGEGDVETGLVPRRLVEDELRAQPSDLILIEARGSSMSPDFMHGDQILIDKRDQNITQPGVFALWDGDAYVIKLVERLPSKRGWMRIMSRDKDLTAYEVESEQVVIMGRPVWFGRRL